MWAERERQKSGSALKPNSVIPTLLPHRELQLRAPLPLHRFPSRPLTSQLLSDLSLKRLTIKIFIFKFSIKVTSPGHLNIQNSKIW